MLTGGARWATGRVWLSWRAWPRGPRLWGSWRRGSRSAVSQHLKILKDAGLVEDVAAGTRRIYRLNPVALAALRDQLDTYWQRALAGYARAAEAPDEEG
jgi:Bacterial regulatory protein, arsR family